MSATSAVFDGEILPGGGGQRQPGLIPQFGLGLE